MKEFLILVILLRAEAALLDRPNDEIEISVSTLLSCDPIGTMHNGLNGGGLESPRRCLCRPYFHGERCEKIIRCQSGRPRNITCPTSISQISPTHPLRQQIGQRCLRGQEYLEVCDCFPGYSGSLCEKTAPRISSQFNVIYQRAPLDLSSYKQRDEKGFDEEIKSINNQIDQKLLESSGWTGGRPAYKMLLFLVDLLIFVAILACCRWIWLKTVHRNRNKQRRVYDLLRQIERLESQAGLIIESPQSNETQSQVESPPTYEEAVERSKRLRDQNRSSTSRARQLAESLERTSDGIEEIKDETIENIQNEERESVNRSRSQSSLSQTKGKRLFIHV